MVTVEFIVGYLITMRRLYKFLFEDLPLTEENKLVEFDDYEEDIDRIIFERDMEYEISMSKIDDLLDKLKISYCKIYDHKNFSPFYTIGIQHKNDFVVNQDTGDNVQEFDIDSNLWKEKLKESWSHIEPLNKINLPVKFYANAYSYS